MKKFGAIFWETLCLFFCLLSINNLYAQSAYSKIKIDKLTQVVNKGKLVKVKATIYYDYNKGKMVTHVTYPEEYINIVNNIGENKLYFPKDNKVHVSQNFMYSSEHSMLYYFMSNQTYDLGLKAQGFNISDTRFEDNLVVTTWSPPPHLMDKLQKVEIVQEENLPIYAAYHLKDGSINRKTYYYNYESSGPYIIPMKITEINYTSKIDSTVSRNSYSNLRMGLDAASPYFEFEVPDNAKLIDNLTDKPIRQ